MKAVRLSRAVVSLPALDLRADPRHAAELGSQLLMGETVRILGPDQDSGWLRVRNDADGYTGWVRAWGLVAATPTRVARWQKRALARIGVPMALVRSRRGGGPGVSPVFFGNRLIASRASRGWCSVELPDGRRGFLPAEVLMGRRGASLADRIASLFGTPYLWGGRTPAGYDCSAFVQQVLLEQDVVLPRDARQQHRACRRLRESELHGPGDLAFFCRPGEPASHVGIALRGDIFVHCRGRVQMASLSLANALCDNELVPQFMGWFRPRSRRPAGGLGVPRR